MCFFKTAFFLYFLFLTSPLSAQENVTPVKIESPTSSFVSRSFTIGGSAQAGAKLHLRINGKTFGRYRATIEGKFTIGVSVPEDKLFVEITHLVDGVVKSSDSIRLEVGAEKVLKKNKETEEKTKNEIVNEKRTTSETTEIKRTLPSAGKIPTKPGVLKKQYTDENDTLEKQGWEKDSVVLNKNKPYLPRETNSNQTITSSMGGRIALEALGGVAVTVGMIGVTIFLVGLEGRGLSEELTLSLFAAELALAPLGVYFGGKLAGGKADLWPIYIGELLGIAGSVGIIIGGSTAGSGTQELLAILALASPFVGMITAYEISHAMNVGKSQNFSVLPTIRINNDVKSLGLTFQF